MKGSPIVKTAAALLAVALATTGVPAAAQDIDVPAAKQAIDTLANFPRSVQAVRAQIGGTNFGPFPASGSCDHDCFIVCFSTFNWNWSPDFSWLKDDLSRRYQSVETVSNGFDNAFSPVKLWLVEWLPRYSGIFNEEAARMSDAARTYSDPSATTEQKAQAEATVRSGIDRLKSELDAGAGQINTGISTLSHFNSNLAATFRFVEAAAGPMESMIAANQKVLDDSTAGWPCGSGDIHNHYNNVKSIVRAQYQNVAQAAQRANTTAGAADHAVSIILGTVLNFQNQLTGVRQKLQAAETTPAGAVQQLRVNVAGAAFKELVAYAQQQLGK